MKIVVVSDSHKNCDVLNRILFDNPDADYYFHLGDSEMEEHEIKPFISVRGNVDFDYNFPNDRVIDIGKFHFYLTHGDQAGCNPEILTRFARAEGCNVVLFGHSHIFYYDLLNGIRLLNPGSCSRPKDSSIPSYSIINIDNNDNFIVKRVFIER